MIAPANAGGEAINSIKQATEFGVVPGSQKFVSLPTFINDVDGWGLRQGTRLAGAFLRRPGRQNPGLVVALFEIDQQATKYGGGWCRSSTTHDPRPSRPPRQVKNDILSIRDFFARDGHIRLNGQMIHAIVSLRGQAA